MKNLYTVALILFVIFSVSCKKFIEAQEKKAAMNIITNGNWYVEQYVQNEVDVTSSFSGYLFKFDENGAVTGKKDDISQVGTWLPDIPSRTITSNFPTGTPPVSLLNAKWKIKDSYNDLVIASYNDSVNSNTLRLRKQ